MQLVCYRARLEVEICSSGVLLSPEGGGGVEGACTAVPPKLINVSFQHVQACGVLSAFDYTIM